MTITVWPALVDENDEVALRVFSGPLQAATAMRGGLKGLILLQLKSEIKYLRRKIPKIDSMALRYTAWGSKDHLIQDIIAAAVNQCFIESQKTPRNREAFQQLLTGQKPHLVAIANTISEHLGNALDASQRLNQRIRKNGSLAWVEAVGDIQDQTSELLKSGVAQRTPMQRLKRFPVYFEAIEKRLDALDRSPDRDRKTRAELLPLWEAFKQIPTPIQPLGEFAEAWQGVRWSFEELRISLFAQNLRTIEKVSLERVENALKKLKRLDPS